VSRSVGVWARKTLRRLRPAQPPTLVDIPDQTAGPGREQKIPRVVYQTAETRLTHPTHAKSIHEFRALNPDLSFHVFDKEKRDQYMAEHWSHHDIHKIYQRAIFGQMKADIFRYCIIYDKGGYYIDYNKGATTPLTQLHEPHSEGVVSYETHVELLFPPPDVANSLSQPTNLVMQWFFAFRPKHPLLAIAISNIVDIEPFFRDVVFHRPKSALLAMTGPGLFTSVFRCYVAEHGTAGIHEAGVDLQGTGLFRLRGSKFLTTRDAYYGSLRHQIIIAS